MALLAVHAGADVARVIELDEIGKLVDALPADRLPPLLVAAELLDLRASGFDDPMAAHAQVDRRHGCHRRLISVGVTVEAVHLVSASVTPVAEKYGLLRPAVPSDHRIG